MIQGYREARIHGYMGQGFKDTRSKDTRTQRGNDTRIQGGKGYRGAMIHGYMGQGD